MKMMNWRFVKKLAKQYLPSSISKHLRLVAVRVRYMNQKYKCRKSYYSHNSEKEHPILFIAGMPKSGTTWMENMLTSYEGYNRIMIPEAVAYGVRNNAKARDFQLPCDIFERHSNMLGVMKLHIHGSRHNIEVLSEAGIPYLVMHRDLRDVAVSYVHYARKTPWHPKYEKFSNISIKKGLMEFAREELSDFVEWIQQWAERRDKKNSIILKYEELLDKPFEKFREVSRLFDISEGQKKMKEIVRKNKFENMKKYSSASRTHESSFFRRGSSGDWKNHFDSSLRDLYKEKCGSTLIKFGYEDSLEW